MSYQNNPAKVDLFAIEVEARRLRANWVRSLFSDRKAR